MSGDNSGNFAMHEAETNEDSRVPGGSSHPGDRPESLIEGPKIVFPPPEDRLSKLLLDSDGLRPIWRLLLYLAMSRVLYLLLEWVMYYVGQSDLPELWLDMLSEFAFLLAAFIPALIMARLEGRSLASYGLPGRGAFRKLFWGGAVWGIAALTVLMLTLHVAGVFSVTRVALHGTRVLKLAAFWGAFFLIVAFAEEFLLRGYSQFTLAQAVGFWPAAAVLSVGFGAIHLLNPGEAWNGIVAATAIGLFFCLTLQRTGSLWFAVGFHAAWDWGESYLYSVPDSGQIFPGHLLKSSLHGSPWLTGGSVGPEGSVLIFILLALLWLLFGRVYPPLKRDHDSSDRIIVA